MDKRIIEELEANIEKTSENKSSHWKKYLYKNIDYKNPHTRDAFCIDSEYYYITGFIVYERQISLYISS